jgi:hypothetical protein
MNWDDFQELIGSALCLVLIAALFYLMLAM